LLRKKLCKGKEDQPANYSLSLPKLRFVTSNYTTFRIYLKRSNDFFQLHPAFGKDRSKINERIEHKLETIEREE
jgi:hypothetical protein